MALPVRGLLELERIQTRHSLLIAFFGHPERGVVEKQPGSGCVLPWLLPCLTCSSPTCMNFCLRVFRPFDVCFASDSAVRLAPLSALTLELFGVQHQRV